jgi:hypothetical protein
MGTHRFRLSVQIRHPDADLAPVAAAIPLKAKWLWKRGERKHDAQGSPIGDPMSSSYGTFEWPVAPDEDLNAALKAAALALEPARAQLQALALSGGEANLVVGWFSNGDSGEAVEPGTIQAMGSLGLALHLLVYFEGTGNGAA